MKDLNLVQRILDVKLMFGEQTNDETVWCLEVQAAT